MQQTSSEEAYRRLEVMAKKQIEMMRKLMKEVCVFFSNLGNITIK